MISVIVPVYNVSPFLGKCLDSLLAQSFKDLEILIIDDGSTDDSGDICDKYAEEDKRITVFHTDNKGLSAARNLGLDKSKGDYIAFVDSDDWIEPEIFDVLLRNAEETGADIVECCVCEENTDTVSVTNWQTGSFSGKEAVHELIQGRLGECVWDKLYKRKCFDTIRFPEGREHEDSSVMYKLLYYAESVYVIPKIGYHYLHRKGSLSRSHRMSNLVGYWLSFKERFFFLRDLVDEDDRQILLMKCALAVARTWAHYYDCSKDDRILWKETIAEMNAFTREKIPLFGLKGWPIRIRIGAFFPHFQNALSFRIAWFITRVV